MTGYLATNKGRAITEYRDSKTGRDVAKSLYLIKNHRVTKKAIEFANTSYRC